MASDVMKRLLERSIFRVWAVDRDEMLNEETPLIDEVCLDCVFKGGLLSIHGSGVNESQFSSSRQFDHQGQLSMRSAHCFPTIW